MIYFQLIVTFALIFLLFQVIHYHLIFHVSPSPFFNFILENISPCYKWRGKLNPKPPLFLKTLLVPFSLWGGGSHCSSPSPIFSRADILDRYTAKSQLPTDYSRNQIVITAKPTVICCFLNRPHYAVVDAIMKISILRYTANNLIKYL